jgi:hypothetical protein
VLAKMRDRGFISASMFEVAVHEPLPNRGYNNSAAAPDEARAIILVTW